MSFFRTFFGSFYSVATYRAAHNKRGHGLIYSLFLVLLVSVWMVGALALKANDLLFGNGNKVEAVLLDVAAQIPVMTLHKGTLKTAEPRAYPIHIAWGNGEDEKAVFAMIDTTGSATHKNMTAPLLFTAEEAIFKNEEKNKIEIHSYADFEDEIGADAAPLIINRALVEGLVKDLMGWMRDHATQIYAVVGLFGWLVLTFVLYLQRIVMLMFLALGGIILAQILKIKPTFETLMRLAAISFTPVTVADVFSITVLGHSLSAIWLMLAGLVLLYVALSVTRETPLAEAA
jgi:hypothetical protein